MIVALLLPFALVIGIWARAVDRASRNSYQVYDAIRIGMHIGEIGIFSDAINIPGRPDFVSCSAQDDGPLLYRDTWRGFAASASGFPSACRTIRIHMRGAIYLPAREWFDLEFDKNWRVSRIGEMTSRLKG